MSEDVSRFLSQVKELGERRIEEDEARSRELEEKILQDRKERQARRAERARSISPQKSSPAKTPPPSSQRTDSQRLELLDLSSSPVLYPTSSSPQLPSVPKSEDDNMATAATTSTSTFPSQENDSPLDDEIKPSLQSSPTRSGTVGRGLSWQRRPNSQTSERPKSRPLSAVAAENAARSTQSVSESTPIAEDFSRDQIASALSSKDPSWFRQTADRGASSAAYRRNQVEDTPTVNPLSARTQLPGMSRSISGESFKNEGASLPDPPALASTISSSVNLSNVGKLGPPLEIIKSDVEPSREARDFMPPSLGLTSPLRAERPVSPTKGAGGFVQSALMKRSDSVSKRWNVQSPPGLQRADSVASNRSSYDPANRASARIRPQSLLREPSVDPARPGSSESRDEDRPASRSSASLRLDTASPDPHGQDSGRVTPPTSPSKTMDPRRWSPTKSSWLESALNKPESPKPKPTQSSSNQPAWMAELQKAKAQKAINPSVDGSKSPTISHKHQVSIGGLLRSSAPGTTTIPVGRGLHSPSPSISNISASIPDVSPRESYSPTMPSLAKSKSEPLGEVKAAETLPPVDNVEPATLSKKDETIPPANKVKPAAPPKKEETIPPVNKIKPATPPKKDFRANLKPRAPPPTASTGSQEIEFKNVFGRLRRATTTNYVAPDELKNNITRGKAALSVTGGPQKSELKDEFKEAILARKKEFQTAQSEGRSATRHNSVSSSVSSEKPIPEGILKRAELGRSKSIKRGSVSSDVPGIDSRRPSIVSKRDPVRDDSSSKPELQGASEKQGSVTELSSSKPEQQVNTRESSTTQGFTISKTTGGATARTNDATVPARLPGKIAASALANRFNPALAGLLARGPPAITPSSGVNASGGSSLDSTTASKTEANDIEPGAGPKLTHLTKNRARGPKRKAPTTSTVPAATVTESIPSETKLSRPDTPKTQENIPVPPSQSEVISPVEFSKKDYPAPAQKPAALLGPTRSGTESTAPVKPDNKINEQVAVLAAKRQPILEKPSYEPQEASPQQPSPGKLNSNRISRFIAAAPEAAESSRYEQPKPVETPQKKSYFDRPSTQDVQQKPQPRSPSLNKPKVPLPEHISLTSKLQHSKADFKPIYSGSESKPNAPSGARPLPNPPGFAARGSSNSPAPSPPKELERDYRPLPSPGLKSPATTASPMRSPTKQSLDSSLVLQDFFGPGRPERSYRVDVAELLMQQPKTTASKAKTLNSQLFQLSADGKKQPVPAHHERTLFEGEMYLCTHSFQNEVGMRMTEVYFWAGDEVPESTIENAGIFVAREARSSGGMLVNLRQGKETPEFIQALGGIVIIQRGSGKKYDSLALHVLCGRRYHGHVVFDEVDCTPSALCSGFPYLITQGGKCYLWKGKGSGVDELSCARLIGMDYALSGEMEEIEEGGEPAAFWDLFEGAKRFNSADHWRLKPNYDKYCCRLFLSDAASRKQISELYMFAQKDLLPTNIYVIDAFFELYIVVGSRAQSQYASFHNALEFAQEYAILAAGMEDRPFVPVSTVVLEGIPRDMKSVFRKWQDALSPTVTNTNVGLKRGRSLKVVSLNQALQALSD